MLFASPGRRGGRRPPLELPPPSPDARLCSAPRCQGSGEIACAHVDRVGRRCESLSCPEHEVVLEGLGYCRRHAAVLTALAGGPPLPGEIDDPLGCRPTVVTWLSRGLDPDVRALLDGFADRPGPGSVETAEELHGGAAPHLARWETSWTCVEAGGLVLQISVEVDQASDPDVIARVDGTVVARQAPAWIGRRLRDEVVDADLDAGQRREFYRYLHNSVAMALEERRRNRAEPSRREREPSYGGPALGWPGPAVAETLPPPLA